MCSSDLGELIHFTGETVNVVTEDVIRDHDYSLTFDQSADEEEGAPRTVKKFAKCDACRKSRTKVLVPTSMISVTESKNDGKTCDFCGNVMNSSVENSSLRAKNVQSNGNCIREHFGFFKENYHIPCPSKIYANRWKLVYLTSTFFVHFFSQCKRW